MSDARERTVCQMRIRNEERLIRHSLERTWEVCASAAIWDDGSTDNTIGECIASLGPKSETRETLWGSVSTAPGKSLHIWRSPFARDDIRAEERVNELRDKNVLFYALKIQIEFDYVLCLDGDEALTLEALRTWPKIIAAMDAGVDFVQLPFVYLWDREDQQRIDAIYGPAMDGNRACITCQTVDCASPRHKRLRFPRVFTTQRLTPRELFDVRFAWTGTRGSFHCGSIPQESFRPGGNPPVIAFAEAPVKHWGYMDEAERQRKYEFYTTIDPDDEFEGFYLHVIERKNQHAPGPVLFAPYEDA